MDYGLPDSEPSSFARKGSVVDIVTWLLIVVSFLAIVGRLLAKWSVSASLKSDDALAVASGVLSLLSAVTVSLQVKYGLGTTIESLSKDSLQSFLKSHYATSMLYLSSVCAAKLSIIILLRLISPVLAHQRLGLAVAALIMTWWITSELALAFQCSIPNTWDFVHNTCIERVSLWYAIGGLNIFTDCALILLPAYIVFSIHMRRAKKALILTSFTVRVADIGVTTAQLVFTRLLDSKDPTANLWIWVIITQLVQCVTIITSCVPYLRQLLEIFPTGMYMSDELRRRGIDDDTARYGSNSKDSYSLRRPSKQSTRSETRMKTLRVLNNMRATRGQTSTTVTTTDDNDQALAEYERFTQNDESKAHILKTTTLNTSVS